MTKNKQKEFVKLPEYPGGKDAFLKFVKENQKYPEEALKNRIEGIVYLELEVNNTGDVLNVKLVKGIGYGCDEEAIRIAKMLKYGRVKNKGMRILAKKNLRIAFKLPGTQLNIEYKVSYPKDQVNEKDDGNYTYSYTIRY